MPDFALWLETNPRRGGSFEAKSRQQAQHIGSDRMAPSKIPPLFRLGTLRTGNHSETLELLKEIIKNHEKSQQNT